MNSGASGFIFFFTFILAGIYYGRAKNRVLRTHAMLDIDKLQEEVSALEKEKPPAVIELAEAIISSGIACGASDIHLEAQADRLFVRFRLNGVLYDVASVNRSLQAQLISRVKVLSDLLTYKTDLPQEGRIKSEKIKEGIDLRVATFPTIYGERVLIRIFTKEKGTFELDELGFDEQQLAILRKHLHSNRGVIFLTGPAGSGKTTTIYSCLKEIVRKSPIKKHILTIEDPVECAIEGVTQTQINPTSGLTFAAGLRSMLRGDPEVLMVGEIRDTETARIGIEAGLTGHLVITTIHSGTACGVFSRLLDMGIEPYLLTSSAGMVLAQRLVRTLCPACRKEAPPPAEMPQLEGAKIFEAAGCDRCAGTGYNRRTAVGEILEVRPEIRRAILERSDVSGIERAALSPGGGGQRFARIEEKAIEKIRSGLTSFEEFKRVFVF